ncbi:MAG: hypothetical protein ACOCM7_05365, partial [Bacteroidales bacterium]
RYGLLRKASGGINNLWVEYVISFDKNHKNRLHRLKPKGTPPGLTLSLKAELSLAINPCGCGRCPTASNDASKKQKKVDDYFLL